ncbi:MAG: ABC transporter permease [Salinigranum sp.]
MSTVDRNAGIVGRARESIAGNEMLLKGLRMALAAIAFLVVWQVVAMTFFDPSMLPTPVQVVEFLPSIFQPRGAEAHGALFHLYSSLYRVVISTVIGMTIAIVLGVLMSVNDPLEDAFSAWLPFWMTIPTVVVVLLSMILFKFSNTSVIVAVVFAATPYATVNMWKGAQNVDGDLLEMAHTVGAGGAAIWKDIYIPSILPSLFGSLRYLLSMVWKIVVLTETFGMDNGMGSQFRFWYQQGNITALLAYLVLFLIVMFAIEYLLLYPVESYLFRWRD